MALSSLPQLAEFEKRPIAGVHISPTWNWIFNMIFCLAAQIVFSFKFIPLGILKSDYHINLVSPEYCHITLNFISTQPWQPEMDLLCMNSEYILHWVNKIFQRKGSKLHVILSLFSKILYTFIHVCLPS